MWIRSGGGEKRFSQDCSPTNELEKLRRIQRNWASSRTTAAAWPGPARWLENNSVKQYFVISTTFSLADWSPPCNPLRRHLISATTLWSSRHFKDLRFKKNLTGVKYTVVQKPSQIFLPRTSLLAHAANLNAAFQLGRCKVTSWCPWLPVWCRVGRTEQGGARQVWLIQLYNAGKESAATLINN